MYKKQPGQLLSETCSIGLEYKVLWQPCDYSFMILFQLPALSHHCVLG